MLKPDTFFQAQSSNFFISQLHAQYQVGSLPQAHMGFVDEKGRKAGENL
jgi:hypothetical protein